MRRSTPSSTVRRVFLVAVGAALSACTVPALDDLGARSCNAEHPCVAGYVCIDSQCVVDPGGDCSPGATRACGDDEGECQQGSERCGDDGSWSGTCENEVGPGTEECNGLDDDCDGDTDEEVTGGGACELTGGVCGGAQRACVAGGWETPCTAASYGSDFEADEASCDGLDNDCDGDTDEDVSAGVCPDEGVCSGAVYACVSGTPGLCQASDYEEDETRCDGLDNDCDGATDEDSAGDPLVGAVACELTTGVCFGSQRVCTGGTLETPCTAVSYGVDYQATESSCDGLDNDCDGSTDIDPSTTLPFVSASACELAAGVCAGARRVCAGGGFETPCTGASYGADYESVETRCDGLDNDCDGETDRSWEKDLGITPGQPTFQLDWVHVSGGLTAVYQDTRSGAGQVYLQRFDRNLVATGGELQLSDPAAARADQPSIAVLADDTGAMVIAVVWVETASTGEQNIELRIGAPDGSSFRTSRAAAAAVLPVGRPAVAGSDQRVLVAWVDALDSAVLATVFDLDGVITGGPTALTLPREAGNVVEQTFDVDAVGRTGTPTEFVVGWAAQRYTSFETSFRVADATLTAVTPTRYGSAGPTSAVDLTGHPTGEVQADWVEQTATGQWELHTAAAPEVTGLDPIIHGPTAELLDHARVVILGSGPFHAWTEGLVTPQVRGSTPSEPLFAVTPSGSPAELAPAVATDGVCAWVGYESDRGTGLDLFARVICDCS